MREPADRWTTSDAAELYDVASWGKGYFSVGKNGNVLVHPTKKPTRAIDLKELVDKLQLRGISLPILIRFAEILKHRLGEMHQAFRERHRRARLQGAYCCVYPIKVNQQRQVVEEVFEYGRPYKFGLEAGSKPELLAVLAIADNADADHLQRLQGRRIHRDGDAGQEDRPQHHPGGRKVHRARPDPEARERVGVRPVIGLRVKLASRGSGRWKSSGGYRSKFGLTVTEALRRWSS